MEKEYFSQAQFWSNYNRDRFSLKYTEFRLFYDIKYYNLKNYFIHNKIQNFNFFPSKSVNYFKSLFNEVIDLNKGYFNFSNLNYYDPTQSIYDRKIYNNFSLNDFGNYLIKYNFDSDLTEIISYPITDINKSTYFNTFYYDKENNFLYYVNWDVITKYDLNTNVLTIVYQDDGGIYKFFKHQNYFYAITKYSSRSNYTLKILNLNFKIVNELTIPFSYWSNIFVNLDKIYFTSANLTVFLNGPNSYYTMECPISNEYLLLSDILENLDEDIYEIVGDSQNYFIYNYKTYSFIFIPFNFFSSYYAYFYKNSYGYYNSKFSLFYLFLKSNFNTKHLLKGYSYELVNIFKNKNYNFKIKENSHLNSYQRNLILLPVGIEKETNDYYIRSSYQTNLTTFDIFNIKKFPFFDYLNIYDTSKYIYDKKLYTNNNIFDLANNTKTYQSNNYLWGNLLITRKFDNDVIHFGVKYDGIFFVIKNYSTLIFSIRLNLENLPLIMKSSQYISATDFEKKLFFFLLSMKLYDSYYNSFHNFYYLIKYDLNTNSFTLASKNVVTKFLLTDEVFDNKLIFANGIVYDTITNTYHIDGLFNLSNFKSECCLNYYLSPNFPGFYYKNKIYLVNNNSEIFAFIDLITRTINFVNPDINQNTNIQISNFLNSPVLFKP